MTVQEFVRSGTYTKRFIADICRVDISQVFRWQNGAVPEGATLLRLVELSKGRIKAEDLPEGSRKGSHLRRGAKPRMVRKPQRAKKA